MGLPLFIAPVDSDIPSKTTAKGPAHPTHTRSPIRRASPGLTRQRRRQLHEVREHRLRLLATLQSEEEPLLPSSARRDNARSASTTDADATLPQQHENDFQRMVLGLEPSEERTSQPSSGDPSSRSAEWTVFRRSSPRPPYISWDREQSWLSDVRDANPRARPSDLRGTSSSVYYIPPRPEAVFSYRADSGARSRGTSEERLRFRRSIPPIHARSVASIRRSGARTRQYDGLGDRDRSLSPEGDGVWDTLQSTLTPDPQPPSASSSFASTSASTVASQRTAPISSANTSITSRDELTELPCDPVADDSDLDDSGDETLDQILGQRLGASSRRSNSNVNRRSYADVVADLSLDSTPTGDASPDWLTGMHRIVRGLASREDIPDEWWAEAGLSRSMREDSS